LDWAESREGAGDVGRGRWVHAHEGAVQDSSCDGTARNPCDCSHASMPQGRSSRLSRMRRRNDLGSVCGACAMQMHLQQLSPKPYA
jgi:hypothetical protein